MIIRTGNIQDIEAIRILAADTWPVAYKEILSSDQLNYMLNKFYSEEALKEQILTKGHQFYIICDVHDLKLGFASVSFEHNQTFKLQKLYVLPSEQGKNLGKMLLDEVISYSIKNGGQRLILNVNRFNRAQFFYKKHNFKIIEEVDIAIGNDYYMNDFVMELNL